MKHAREIFRHKWECGRTHREIARALGISAGTVGDTVSRAKQAGLASWADVAALRDEELASRLYASENVKVTSHPLPDFRKMHDELSRAHVTLELLHEEYRAEHPDGYAYSQYCALYNEWKKKLALSMRQVHKAGEKMFVDFAGQKMWIWNEDLTEKRSVEVFIAVLGASSKIFAMAVVSQQIPNFIDAHIQALKYYGACAWVWVIDQLKSGVSHACRYEPELTRAYRQLAEHYGAVVIPARPRKPKDKGMVEVSVQIVERWVIAKLRDEVFTSLEALNARIFECVEEINARMMKAYGRSRNERFDELDKPALLPLPKERFVLRSWKLAKVHIDYHVEVDGHYYSVPYTIRGEHVDVWFTSSMVEVWHKGGQIAVHPRQFSRGRHTTTPEHMPKSHRKHMEWTPGRLIAWGQTIGVSCGEMVEAILRERPHPEMGYRSCLGILRLGKAYGAERLEAACARGLRAGARSYKSLQTMLEKGLDKVPLPEAFDADAQPLPLLTHANIRGPTYFAKNTSTTSAPNKKDTFHEDA